MDNANESISDHIDITIATRDVTRENEEIKRDDTRVVISRAACAPLAPKVALGLLSRSKFDFVDFILDEDCERYCALLFGDEGTSAATMVAEFRKGIEFHYFGPRTSHTPLNAGKLDRFNSATKKLLAKFAERAYRGDSEGRHINYWKAIARLVWQAFADLKALRERVQKITQREIERQGGLPARRAAAAARAKRYRAKRLAKSGSERAEERLPGGGTAIEQTGKLESGR